MKDKQRCLSCKILSVSVLVGIGSYLIFVGKSQHSLSRISMYGLGTGIIGLGIGEIFDKSPFRES